jgi:hypothetical protein
VDIVVAEQAAALLRPLPLAETPSDAALAVAEAAVYPVLHRKDLSERVATEMAGIIAGPADTIFSTSVPRRLVNGALLH